MKPFKYSAEQLDFLRNGYLTMARAALTMEFNKRFGTDRTVQQIFATLKNHKFTCGRTGRFEKGHTTWNANTKGATSANVTSFRKGNEPKNRKPLGAERIRDGKRPGPERDGRGL